VADDRRRHPRPRTDGRRGAIAFFGSALIAAALTTGAGGSSFAAKSDAGNIRNGWITASRTQLIMKSGVAVVDADGAHRTLLMSEFPVAPSVASPDGRRFACVLGNPPILYVTSASRGESVRIGPSAPAPPSWSPDGSQLAFEGVDGRLEIAAPDGGRLRSLEVTGAQPVWSPTGEQIAFFSSYTTLEVIRPDGSDRTVVDTNAYRSSPGSVQFDVSWSPDGQWLLFGTMSPETTLVDVNVERPDGSRHRSFGHGWSMSWSPNRNVFAFLSDDGLQTAAPDATLSRTQLEFGTAPVAVWSPDGNHVAVADADATETVAVIDPSNGAFERVPLKGIPVWSPDSTALASVKGSTLRVASIGASRSRLAARGVARRSLLWLRGDRLVFASMSRAQGVVETTLEGGSPQVFLRGPASFTWERPAGWFSALEWSPDGHRLAVVREFGRRSRLEVTTRDGRRLRTLARGAMGSPSWSPDSRSLVFETGSGLRTVDADGGTIHALTRAHDEAPAWSPNGQQIAFLRPDRSSSGYALYVFDRDGRHVRPLAHDVTSYPDWSPDGRRLVFSAGFDLEPTAIATIRPDGQGRRRLASAPPAEETGDVLRAPVLWSPDGRWILYYDEKYLCGSKCSEISLLLIRPNGKGRHVLDVDIGAALWSPDGKQLLGFDGVGRLIAVDLRSRAIRFKGGFVDALDWQPRR
jgi:Tol biopolymer transport system component